MQKIIITADDYGMCKEVDEAIDKGLENGFITTTNVMVNMETLENAAYLRKKFPDISVGIHWNVTTGLPICNAEEIPSLVDKSGRFWSINEFKKLYFQGKIDPIDLEKELESQYALFIKVCGKPDYWNTHENSSLSIKAFSVFRKVALRHGIPATRNFQRVYFDKINLGVKTEVREFLVKNFFDVWFKHIKKDFSMPTARIVSFGKVSKTKDDVLLTALKNDGRDCIEVVFHPATTSDNALFGNISTERVLEYEFVCSKQVKERFVKDGIVFSNFADLK